MLPMMTAPLEHYIQLSKEYRLSKIYDVLEKGAIIIGRVASVFERQVLLDAIQVLGKRSRKIYDLEIEIVIPMIDFRYNTPEESEFYKIIVSSIITKMNKVTVFGSIDNNQMSSQTCGHVLGKFNVNAITEHLLLYQ
ncbi:hypothetical protein MXB_3736, partial [Myxobolus squamalis]